MTKFKIGFASAVIAFVAPVVAFADNSMYSVADATSTINTMAGNTNSALLYALGVIIPAGVGMLILGFAWRHGKRLVTGRKF